MLETEEGMASESRVWSGLGRSDKYFASDLGPAHAGCAPDRRIHAGTRFRVPGCKSIERE